MLELFQHSNEIRAPVAALNRPRALRINPTGVLPNGIGNKPTAQREMTLQANAIYNSYNLALLERLPSRQIALVYLDSPWEFPATADSKSLEQNLSFLAHVVQQSKRVLSRTGNLFIVAEPHSIQHLRAILDQVFGRNNFRGEIVWQRKSDHPTILWYAKTSDFVSNRIFRPVSKEEFALWQKSQRTRAPYILADLTSLVDMPSQRFEWKSITPPAHRAWRFTKDRLDQMDSQGLISFPAKKGLPRLKVYFSKNAQIEIGQVWDDIKPLSPISIESEKYPGQKPQALLERVVLLGSNPNDIVLDPFAGAGTALAAAQATGRRWIGCELSIEGHRQVVERLSQTFKLEPGVDFKVGNQEEIEKFDPVQVAYHNLIPTIKELTQSLQLSALIASGANENLEFFPTACRNERTGKKDLRAIEIIAKTIAGMMNAKHEGLLLIGVAKNGKVIGLDKDLAVVDPKKKSHANYELFLRIALNNNLGADSLPFFSICFPIVDGKQICQISVKPSAQPVYFQKSLYVRAENETRFVVSEETAEFIQARWK